jgi:hypothetical protein
MEVLSDSSEDGLLDFELDRNSRLAGVRGLCYSSRSFLNFIPDDATALALRQDALHLDSRKADLSPTFWMPANAAPRFGMERLAKAVFDFHTASATYPASCSGAEWWVQVRDAVGATDESAEAAGCTEGPTIGFHWDKDEIVHRTHGLALHPHLSTVTYLSDVGAPTVVIKQRRPDDESGVTLRTAKEMTLSYPCTGKHFAFDGRFLHGVPNELAPAGRSGRRVSR